MEIIKLFDSELNLMEILWRKGTCTAKEASLLAVEEIGWNKNTTYTILKKLVEKGAIERMEPGFVCHTLITKEQVQLEEAKNLVTKLFDGSVHKLFATFLQSEHLSQEELDKLKDLIEKQGE